MSVALVTVEQANVHLRRDEFMDDEADLELKIEAASEAVIDYLKEAAYDFLDSDGNVVIDSNGDIIAPARIKQAVLLLLGEFYKNREGEQGGAITADFGYGYLPRSVVAVLYPYRLPSIA